MLHVNGLAYTFCMFLIYKYITLSVHCTQGINHSSHFTLFSHMELFQGKKQIFQNNFSKI